MKITMSVNFENPMGMAFQPQIDKPEQPQTLPVKIKIKDQVQGAIALNQCSKYIQEDDTAVQLMRHYASSEIKGLEGNAISLPTYSNIPEKTLRERTLMKQLTLDKIQDIKKDNIEDNEKLEAQIKEHQKQIEQLQQLQKTLPKTLNKRIKKAENDIEKITEQINILSEEGIMITDDYPHTSMEKLWEELNPGFLQWKAKQI